MTPDEYIGIAANSRDKRYYVHPKAKIGKNITLEHGCIIDAETVIGDNCYIGPNTVIHGGTTVGDNCKFGVGVVLGTDPMDVKWDGGKTYVKIGDNCNFENYVVVSRAADSGGSTIVGDNTILMSNCFIAHDCIIGKENLFTNGSTLAGRVKTGSNVTLGAYTAIQPRQIIGDFVYTAWNCGIHKDIPPYLRIVEQNGPLRYLGINIVGLRRNNYTNEIITEIRDIYRLIYESNIPLKEAINTINVSFQDSNHKKNILDFINNSKRGILKKN
tara:strand:+ start:23770 stop:24585 length:816 start_codon:yes stop_codon:yes gene_type:complete